MTGRPFAEHARRLCPETGEHHARVWFCQTCRLLEMRLTPITDVLGDLLEDDTLKAAYRRQFTPGRGYTYTPTSKEVAVPEIDPITPEELAQTTGMPLHVRAGFIAASRGVDVRAKNEALRQQKLTEAALEAHLQDLIAMKMEGQ